MDTGTTNLSWARVLVGALVDGGVRHACVSPGSRSSPLALAIAESHGLTNSVHVDERSAGYFAVGYGRLTGVPAMLLCTSGTAAANYLPAVVEAHYGRVPLVVVTADRPPELRDSGARQTIDQLNLYGGFVLFSADVPVPTEDDKVLHQLMDVGRRSATLAAGSPAGPVHLNVPFREPLLPEDLALRPEAAVRSKLVVESAASDGAERPESPPKADERIQAAAAEMASHPRGVIVAGQIDRIGSGYADAIVRLAGATGYPILAEPTSGLRFGEHDLAHVVSHQEAVLRSTGWRAAHVPDVVVRIGEDVVWRHVTEHLDVGSGAISIVLGRHAEDRRAAPASLSLDGVPTQTCDALVRRLGRSRDAHQGQQALAAEWPREWRQADETAAAALDFALSRDSDGPRSTGWVHRAVVELAPEDAVVWVANSMAVRDADSFAGSSKKQLTYSANWGAAGIDGTVSSAFGAAFGSGRPTVLITGDLAFAHDVNGLAAAQLPGLDVTVVMLNDGGGGIFEHLPVASLDKGVFERFFTTPPGLDVAAACRTFGVAHTMVRDASSLSAVMDAGPGVRVAEVEVDRAANTAWHRRYWDAVDSAIVGRHERR